MAAATTYLKSKLLNHSLGLASFTMPTTIYVGLLSGESAEISKEGYARKAVSLVESSSGSPVSNSTSVEFRATTEDWGAVNYIGLFDALTEGNLLYIGSVGVNVSAGEGVQFPIGNIRISIS